MISKRLDPATWHFEATGPYITSLHLTLNLAIPHNLTIINIYNPQSSEQRIRIWDELATVLQRTTSEVVLLGDFNAHHPKWGGPAAATEPQACYLIQELKARQLSLLTPRGEPTWRRGTRQSTIDLTFTSLVLTNRVVFCGPEERWAITQDHIPIRIHLSVAIDPPRPRERFAIQKLEHDKFLLAIQQSPWLASPQPLPALQTAITNALQKYCPRARPSAQARRKWSPRASELLTSTRRARRDYNQSGQPYHQQSYKAHANLLKKELRRVERNNWRRFIAEHTSDADTDYNKGL
jgi:hypothetical protein